MGEFLRLKPPTFAGSSNPLDADDWLRTIKRKLEAIGCPENQHVQLVAHQLSGMALAWWDTFSAAVRDATWAEFETAFREHHVPQGIVQLKEDEFRELTQGEDLSVSTCTNSQSWLVTRLTMSASKPRRWPVF
jgi:predicted alpha/beta hydrolase family esterase